MPHDFSEAAIQALVAGAQQAIDSLNEPAGVSSLWNLFENGNPHAFHVAVPTDELDGEDPNSGGGAG